MGPGCWGWVSSILHAAHCFALALWAIASSTVVLVYPGLNVPCALSSPLISMQPWLDAHSTYEDSKA